MIHLKARAFTSKPFELSVFPLLWVPSYLLPEGPEKIKNERTTLKQKPVQNLVGKRCKQTAASRRRWGEWQESVATVGTVSVLSPKKKVESVISPCKVLSKAGLSGKRYFKMFWYARFWFCSDSNSYNVFTEWWLMQFGVSELRFLHMIDFSQSVTTCYFLSSLFIMIHN